MAKEKVEFAESDFKNSDAKRRYYNEFEKRVCITQRKVDVKSLESDGVRCFQWINQMGYEKFLNLDELTRENYTRLFYANIEPKPKDTKPMIYVNGQQQELTSGLLNKILGIPNEGAIVHPQRGNLRVGRYSPKTWCKILSGKRVEQKVPAASLNKSRKVLHYYICEMLYPKGGTIDKVSNFEAFLLWAIENNYKLNLGHIIIEKIVSARNKSESRLPFGMVISKIYQYFGETFSKETGKNVSQIMNASWVKTLSFSDESVEETEKDEEAKRKKDIYPDSYSTKKQGTGYLKKLKIEPSDEKKRIVQGIIIDDSAESKKQAGKKESNGASKKFKGKTKLEPSSKEQQEEIIKRAMKRSRKEYRWGGSSSQSNESSAVTRDVVVKEDDFGLIIDPKGAEDENDQPKNGAREMKEQAITEEATQQQPTSEEQDHSQIDGPSFKGFPSNLKPETISEEKKSSSDGLFTSPEDSSAEEGYNTMCDLIAQADDSLLTPNESDFVKPEDIVLNKQSDENIPFILEADHSHKTFNFDDDSPIFGEGENSGLITNLPSRIEAYSAWFERVVSQPAPPADIIGEPYVNANAIRDYATGMSKHTEQYTISHGGYSVYLENKPDGTLMSQTVDPLLESFASMSAVPRENMEQSFSVVEPNGVVSHVEPHDENMEQPFAVIEPNAEQARPPNADLELRMNVVEQDVAEVKEQMAAMAAAISSIRTELKNVKEQVEALPSLIVVQIRDMLTPPKP